MQFAMRFLMFSLVVLMLRIVFNVFWDLSSGERDRELFLFTFHCDGVYMCHATHLHLHEGCCSFCKEITLSAFQVGK